MGKTNFRIFAEAVDPKNIESDLEYESDTQRVSGVVPGIAIPAMHNKLYKQSTIMAAAIAQIIVQGGLDALDNDYTGLVKNMRQTFAGSVNGIRPDETGNIDITKLFEDLRQLTYPRVGDFIITRNKENPNKKYPGTTWELLPENTFIMSAGSTVPAGTEGGSNTHTMTAEELAPHNHTYTMGASGGHNHTRGTMNITGEFFADDSMYNSWYGPLRGAFTKGRYIGHGDWDSDGGKQDCGQIAFDASRSWTGETSYVAAHTHDLTINNAGSGKTWDSRPKYIAAYIWVRTA